MAVATGQSFGNFQVVRLLGEGGFGEVYEAENPFLQRKAAVKVLHTGMVQDPELVRRFLNEARAASGIRHPNIIEVFDAGVTPDGAPYILMEFLEGDSLQKAILQQGRMPLRTVQEIARQAGSALSAAHAAGIVHRDLKPENVYLVPDVQCPLGIRVKVLDFGIAKIKHRDDQNSTLKTQAGLLMGSPAYMSPEQCRDSSDVDLRSDIYSLAIMVHEMLSGVPPFASKSATEMLVLQMTADPPPLRAQLPDLPDYIEQAVLRALAKDREKRYASVDYFVGALLGSYPAQTTQGTPKPAGPSATGMVRPSGFDLSAPIRDEAAAPVGLDGFSRRLGGTPSPSPLVGPNVTTLSRATGEVSPIPSASELDLEAVKPRRWPMFAAFMLVVCVVGAVVAWKSGVLSMGKAREASRPTLPVPPPPPPSSRPPEPANIRLQIHSSPSGAAVVDSKDGLALGTTPFDQTYPRGAGRMDLVIRMAGYQDKTVNVDLAGNSTTSVDLERVEEPRAPVLRKTKASAAERRRPAPARKPPPPTHDEEEEWRVH
jgi:serine/threonine protein kinase